MKCRPLSITTEKFNETLSYFCVEKSESKMTDISLLNFSKKEGTIVLVKM